MACSMCQDDGLDVKHTCSFCRSRMLFVQDAKIGTNSLTARCNVPKVYICTFSLSISAQ
jgi:hypothetical protein